MITAVVIIVVSVAAAFVWEFLAAARRAGGRR